MDHAKPENERQTPAKTFDFPARQATNEGPVCGTHGWLTYWNQVKRMADEFREQRELKVLDAKLKILLPLQYQVCYNEVQPVSMGSAGLKFDSAGRVAWDEIWGGFCDLAMAGGPPHKGTLLEPASLAEIEGAPDRYKTVVDEICRGIRMVSDSVAVEPSANPGWVRVMCPIPGMAGWLVRAITMENVSAHVLDSTVELPVGPYYRLEKEIKNVITVVAKTCHYFAEHMATGQQRKVAQFLAESEAESPLLQPAVHGHGFKENRIEVSEKLFEATGLQPSMEHYSGWTGLECRNVRAAIWMMRALVVHGVLSRREGVVLFVPINPLVDPDGGVVVRAVADVWRLATAQGVLD